MRTFRVGCAVIATTLGCNSIVGINQPVDKDSASSSGAVPPGDGGAVTGVDRFVGRWSIPGNNQTLTNCSDGSPDTPLTSRPWTLVVSPGENDTMLLSPELGPNCRVVFSVLGDEATLVLGQSCAFELDGDTFTYNYIAPTTFTLAPTGAQANVRITATLRVNGDTCRFTETGVYTKQ